MSTYNKKINKSESVLEVLLLWCFQSSLSFNQFHELNMYIVVPAVIMKFLPVEVHRSHLQHSSVNEPNGIWAILHLSETVQGVTASATSCNAMQTFMTPIHLEETIRTNCFQVQQSRPGAIIYEPDHLRVVYARTRHRLSATLTLFT